MSIVGLSILTLLAGFAEPVQSSELQAYRAALGRLESYYGEYRGRGRVTETIRTKSEPNSPRISTHQLNFAASGGKKRVSAVVVPEAADAAPGYFERVYVVDPPQMFSVVRKAPDGVYTLSQSGSMDSTTRFVIRSVTAALFLAPTSLGTFPMDEVVGSPNFSVQKVSNVDVGGESMLRFDFTRTHVKGHNGLKGWFIVDPSRAYVIQSFEYKISNDPDSPVFNGTITYAAHGGDTPPITSRVVQSTRQQNGSEEIRIFDLEHAERTSSPSGAFTLAAFGLGDLSSPIPQRNLLPLWCFLVAAAAGVVALILRAAGRRARRASI